MQRRAESNSITAELPRSATQQRRWILAPREELNVGAIGWSEICGSECVARLLLRKGFHSLEEVENFLRPRLSSLTDPFLLPEMRAAVHRYNPDGTGHEVIATGLRNTVGLRFYPGTTQLWATVEERNDAPDAGKGGTKVRKG